MAKHTKDILGDALETAGLHEMAKKAREGYYHDFLSPLALPELQLLEDLQQRASDAVSNGWTDRVKQIRQLIERHMNGDFDASVEESDEWAQSPQGQDAFSKLIRE